MRSSSPVDGPGSQPAAALADRRPPRVYLEVGRTRVFACALDWPGWCRRARGRAESLQALRDYAPRYFRAVDLPGPDGEVEVLGEIAGDATTEFGAPGTPTPWGEESSPVQELTRLARVAEACWSYFDAVAGSTSGELSRAPRGGGRSLDRIVEHVREAERMYARRLAVALSRGAPWEEQRRALSAAWRSGAPGARWPVRYGIRRCAWHVLDHAFEIADRSG